MAEGVEKLTIEKRFFMSAPSKSGHFFAAAV
jgi:hypothetical protein